MEESKKVSVCEPCWDRKSGGATPPDREWVIPIEKDSLKQDLPFDVCYFCGRIHRSGIWWDLVTGRG